MIIDHRRRAKRGSRVIWHRPLSYYTATNTWYTIIAKDTQALHWTLPSTPIISLVRLDSSPWSPPIIITLVLRVQIQHIRSGGFTLLESETAIAYKIVTRKGSRTRLLLLCLFTIRLGFQ